MGLFKKAGRFTMDLIKSPFEIAWAFLRGVHAGLTNVSAPNPYMKVPFANGGGGLGAGLGLGSMFAGSSGSYTSPGTTITNESPLKSGIASTSEKEPDIVIVNRDNKNEKETQAEIADFKLRAKPVTLNGSDFDDTTEQTLAKACESNKWAVPVFATQKDIMEMNKGVGDRIHINPDAKGTILEYTLPTYKHVKTGKEIDAKTFSSLSPAERAGYKARERLKHYKVFNVLDETNIRTARPEKSAELQKKFGPASLDVYLDILAKKTPEAKGVPSLRQSFDSLPKDLQNSLKAEFDSLDYNKRQGFSKVVRNASNLADMQRLQPNMGNPMEKDSLAGKLLSGVDNSYVARHSQMARDISVQNAINESKEKNSLYNPNPKPEIQHFEPYADAIKQTAYFKPTQSEKEIKSVMKEYLNTLSNKQDLTSGDKDKLPAHIKNLSAFMAEINKDLSPKTYKECESLFTHNLNQAQSLTETQEKTVKPETHEPQYAKSRGFSL